MSCIGAVTAYQKNDIEPIRIDVLDAHGRRQRGTQLLHIALLLLDFVRVVAVVSKVEAQRVNRRSHPAGTCDRDLESSFRELAMRRHEFFGPKPRRMRFGVLHRPHIRT
jgi:hypothetical protein